MKEFIKKLLDSRPHQNLMEYLIEWNDGSIEWVLEAKLREDCNIFHRNYKREEVSSNERIA